MSALHRRRRGHPRVAVAGSGARADAGQEKRGVVGQRPAVGLLRVEQDPVEQRAPGLLLRRAARSRSMTETGCCYQARPGPRRHRRCTGEARTPPAAARWSKPLALPGPYREGDPGGHLELAGVAVGEEHRRRVAGHDDPGRVATGKTWTEHSVAKNSWFGARSSSSLFSAAMRRSAETPPATVPSQAARSIAPTAAAGAPWPETSPSTVRCRPRHAPRRGSRRRARMRSPGT